MKRPLFIAAVIVLSGMVCGIKESGTAIRTAAFIAAVLTGHFLIKRHTDVRKRFISAAVLAALFLTGFARGAVQSHIYNSSECSTFYESFKPTNPGLFDYSLYLKSLGISSREQYDVYKGEAEQPDKPPAAVLLDKVRRYCADIYDSTLSKHDAGICKAVVLGDKSDMDTEIRDLYQDAGIAHLLAVSGLHVSMIGAGLYKLLRRKLRAKPSAVVVSIVLFLYMLMTGASGSVIRAVIMLILNIAALVLGRSYCMTTAISISAIAVMLYRPYMIFTSGFQLSFGAVASISLISQNITNRLELMMENSGCSHNISNKITRYIRKKNRLPAAAKAFIVSASIQLGTLPIIAYHFYKIPVYGILLNFIVIPLMAAVLASGLSLIGAGTVIRVLVWLTTAAGADGIKRLIIRAGALVSAAAAAPGHYVLILYERLGAATLSIPHSSVCLGRPAAIQIIIYYIILAGAVLLLLKPKIAAKRSETALRALLCLTVLILNANTVKYRDGGALCITAIDVGQGDSFLIKNGNTAVLIDGGSSSRKNIGSRVIEDVLLAKGISKLDAIAVSHADADHINGIEYLLGEDSAVTVKELILPKPSENDADYDGLKKLFIDGGGKNISCPEAGELIFSISDMKLSCIYPGLEGDDKNRQSLVLLLENGDFSMLFTGDTEAEDEAIFSSREYLDSIGMRSFDSAGSRLTVLKAAHHGSSSSNSDEIFDSLSPRLLLVSCGKSNRYGHPHEEVLSRAEEAGSRVLRTDEAGAISIYVDGKRVRIVHCKQQE